VTPEEEAYIDSILDLANARLKPYGIEFDTRTTRYGAVRTTEIEAKIGLNRRRQVLARARDAPKITREILERLLGDLQVDAVGEFDDALDAESNNPTTVRS